MNATVLAAAVERIKGLESRLLRVEESHKRIEDEIIKIFSSEPSTEVESFGCKHEFSQALRCGVVDALCEKCGVYLSQCKPSPEYAGIDKNVIRCLVHYEVMPILRSRPGMIEVPRDVLQNVIDKNIGQAGGG
jgi:hypothetical protein